MRKSSIFFSITFIFGIATIGIFIAYLYMVKYDKQKYTHELNERYSIVSRVALIKLLNSSVDEKFEQDLKIYKMIVIKNDTQIKNILKYGEVLQSLGIRIGRSSIIYYKRNNYLLIESTISKRAVLLKDRGYVPYRNQIWTIRIIFGSLILMILGVYYWTIKKIKPIKKIKEEIDKFATGNLDISCKMNTDDEIAEVANAFDFAVSEIKKLNNSRKLFLRNIMHELKTPITKGRITVEMIEDGKQKERLKSAFIKLEDLLNEFISIEQITVDNSFIKKDIFSIKYLINEAIELTMANSEYIEIVLTKDFEIKADKKLFSLALKNLIDNGLKYSLNNRVKVEVKENKINIISFGGKLEHNLSYYTEPFTQDEKNSKKGFGLGLYIVDNILKAHNLKLDYFHFEDKNYFVIEEIVKIV